MHIFFFFNAQVLSRAKLSTLFINCCPKYFEQVNIVSLYPILFQPKTFSIYIFLYVNIIRIVSNLEQHLMISGLQ